MSLENKFACVSVLRTFNYRTKVKGTKTAFNDKVTFGIFLDSY